MPITDIELNRLRWRCRRGFLANDLVLVRFGMVCDGRKDMEKPAAEAAALLPEGPRRDLATALLRATGAAPAAVSPSLPSDETSARWRLVALALARQQSADDIA